jgi:hypothetical protein
MLVARAQLAFVRDLIARFEREDSIMRPVVDHQSQYVAIIALLRSVGHVFEKVDCKEPERRAWSKAQWPIWRQEKIFEDFIEPTRNALLKEFQGGLQLRGEAFESPAVVVDPSMPEGVGLLAAFNARAARDLHGRPVLPQLHAAVAFWDRCLNQAEAAFNL